MPERENAVLSKICEQNQGPIKNEALRAIYRELMSAAIALESAAAGLRPRARGQQHPQYRDEKIFGASVDYHPMAAISDIFTAVERGEADLAVIPIENSTEGSVRETLDSFVESDLKIVGQIYLEINHALISRVAAGKNRAGALQGPGARPVPQLAAAAMCPARAAGRRAEHLPRGADRPRGSRPAAAVAENWPRMHYGVPVVARNIQDKADNTTRFFVLGRKPAGPVGGART